MYRSMKDRVYPARIYHHKKKVGVLSQVDRSQHKEKPGFRPEAGVIGSRPKMDQIKRTFKQKRKEICNYI